MGLCGLTRYKKPAIKRVIYMARGMAIKAALLDTAKA
jgi:hypothetical protein